MKTFGFVVILTLSFYIALRSQQQDYFFEVAEIERKRKKPGVIPKSDAEIMNLIKEQKRAKNPSYLNFVQTKERMDKQKTKNKTTTYKNKNNTFDDKFENLQTINDFDEFDDLDIFDKIETNKKQKEKKKEDDVIPIYLQGERVM